MLPKKFKKASGLALASALCIIAPFHRAIEAAVSNGNLTVTANVSNTCSISTQGLDFSQINVGSVTDEATPGEVNVICTSDQTGATVTLNGGQNESAGTRRLESSGAFMAYNLFTDAAHTNPISIGGNLFSGNITAATSVTHNIYGQVPAGTYLAGTYNDVLVVTLTY